MTGNKGKAIVSCPARPDLVQKYSGDEDEDDDGCRTESQNCHRLIAVDLKLTASCYYYYMWASMQMPGYCVSSCANKMSRFHATVSI